jgi:dsRNA-specific ribonuclease
MEKIAEEYFSLDKFIFKSKNQDLLGKDKKILADIFEAICGAIYLDVGNLETVEVKMIQRFYNDWDSIMDSTIFNKGKLNKYLQQKYHGNPNIKYEYEKRGPQDDLYWKVIETDIYDDRNDLIANFNIKSNWYKKQKFAEQEVASKILEVMKKEVD